MKKMYDQDIESIRKQYLKIIGSVFERYETSEASLYHDETIRENYDNLYAHKSDVRMQRPCNGHFTCTFIGTSSAGKTTFLQELFPDLNERGWMETDANDTTAQGMVISHSNRIEDVFVNSYSYHDLRKFFKSSEEEAAEGGVEYSFDDSAQTIHVNGEKIIDTAATTAEKKEEFAQIKTEYRYPTEMSFRPFTNFKRSGGDSTGVKSLTTMELSSEVNAETGYCPLQMRATIKDIHLSSNYSHLLDLLDSDEDRELMQNIDFIDTPGQGTSGAARRDEILYYTLYHKAQNIIEQLCRDDELDFLVYMKMLGDQNNIMSGFWKKLRPKADGSGIPRDIYDDLEKRLIILINSTRQFDRNGDIKNRWASPTPGETDQIQMYLVQNILHQFMGAETKPSAICFIDTLAAFGFDLKGKNYPLNVESAKDECNKVLEKLREPMIQWTRRGGSGYDTLLRLNLIHEDDGTDDSGKPFTDNIEHLCNREDRGQGFFLKTLIDIIKEQGPVMLFKKHLVRSHLESDFSTICKILNQKYNTDGSLKSQELEAAFNRFVFQNHFREVTGIDDFVKEKLDGEIQDYIDGQLKNMFSIAGGKEFMSQLYEWLLETITQKIEALTSENRQVHEFVMAEIRRLAPILKTRWGYETTQFNFDRDTSFKFVYFLKIHTRAFLEILFYQPHIFKDSGNVQTAEDKKQMKIILENLNDLDSQIRKLRRELSVGY